MSVEIIKEEPREVPVIADVDVLVLGAGPAGMGAAIQAGREGVSVMLVEQSGDVGGVATTGLMSHWTGHTEGGIYEEILQRADDSANLLSYDGAIDFNGEERQIINPEKLKYVFLEMLEEANVRLKLYTFASAPIMDGDTIKGVIVESKSGREAIRAKIVIDCTGDGDIAARAGAPFQKGRESDGKMQPVTLMFKVGGVRYEDAIFPGCFEDHIMIDSSKIKALEDKEDRAEKYDIQKLGSSNLPAPSGHVLLYRSTLPGVVTCNMTNVIGIDGTNSDDLTASSIICRKQIEKIMKFLKNYVPGFEDCYLLSSASQIGVRETRHFIGEKQITEHDIVEARVFEDWIVTKASFNFDVHNISGSGLDETGSQKNFTQTKGYTIPYGCFVPKKIDNLLLAGRNISGTHMAHSNYRVMPICANMGQSVAIAASLCVKNNVIPRNLDVKLIQKRLIEIGVEV